MASLRVRTMTILLALALFCSEMAVGKNQMFSGESLKTNELLLEVSDHSLYRFIMQGDCNLVLYRSPALQLSYLNALWSSRTDGKGTSCRATLQNDGNLVILDDSSVVVWNSTSAPAPAPNKPRLIVQDDGNVVIYGGAIWATNTF